MEMIVKDYCPVDGLLHPSCAPGGPYCQVDGLLIEGHPRCIGCGILAGPQHLETRLQEGIYKLASNRDKHVEMTEGACCANCVNTHSTRGFLRLK